MLISFYRECVKNNEHSETNGSVWKQLVNEKGQMRIPRLIHTVKGPVHTSTVAVFGHFWGPMSGPKYLLLCFSEERKSYRFW